MMRERSLQDSHAVERSVPDAASIVFGRASCFSPSSTQLARLTKRWPLSASIFVQFTNSAVRMECLHDKHGLGTAAK